MGFQWQTLLLLAAQGLVGAGAVTFPALSRTLVQNTIVPGINGLLQATPAFHGQFLRLAFHDCAGSGGCDGCVNTNLAENAGLATAVTALEGLYTNPTNALNTKLSRADLWALAGTVVVNNAFTRRPPGTPAVPAPLPYSSFQYGRTDCATAPMSTADVSSDFPSATLGSAGVLQYFSSRFSFSDVDTVAIMGAHHIGAAHLQNSGFQGPWVPPGGGMDGAYYRNLANANLQWRQAPANPAAPLAQRKFQWVPGQPNAPRIMMLDADMALFKSISPVASSGAVSCPYSSTPTSSACPMASTSSQVTLYGTNQKQFQTDFTRVFLSMQAVCGRTSGGARMDCGGLKQVQ